MFSFLNIKNAKRKVLTMVALQQCFPPPVKSGVSQCQGQLTITNRIASRTPSFHPFATVKVTTPPTLFQKRIVPGENTSKA